MGGLLSGIRDFLVGKPDKQKKVDVLSKPQSKLQNSLIQQLLGAGNGLNTQQYQFGPGFQPNYDFQGNNQFEDYYQNLLQPGNQSYQNFAQPFMNQFNEQTLPQIAERFAGAGALSSSGFGQALGGAASGLQSNLAQLFATLQNQAAESQQGQYNKERGFNLAENEAAQNQYNTMFDARRNQFNTEQNARQNQYYNLANLSLGHPAFGYQNQQGSQGLLGTAGTGLAQGFGSTATNLLMKKLFG